MDSFKRLSPYIGPNIPEQVRQNFKDLWHNEVCYYEPGGWAWDDGSGLYQCELELCDMDSDTIDPAGYVAIVPLEGGRCRIRCVLDEKFQADEEILTSKIFETISQAKAFLDSVLAFATPEIPPPLLPESW
jgi:hypothetical protein